MMKISRIFFIFILIGLTFAEMPSYIKICGRRNPNLDQCLMDSIHAIRPKLKDGIPEWDVPSANPLLISGELQMIKEPNLLAFATDIKVYNATDTIIKKLHLDLENKKLIIDLHFNELTILANYHVLAKILVDLDVYGDAVLKPTDITARIVMTYTHRIKKGEKYWFFTSMTTKCVIKDYTCEFKTKLDPVIEEAIVTALNSNRQELIDAFTPRLETTISTKILKLVNKICEHLPYDESLPDRE